jgi:hypothetical protein
MKNTLSLSLTSAAALAVFATLMAAPLQAADRQIVIEPKTKTLTSVEEPAAPGGVDVASGGDEQAPPQKVKPRIFEVDEGAPVAGASEAAATPQGNKPPKTLEFSVDEETGQVADTPVETEADDTPAQPKRPAKIDEKIVKKAPKQIEPDTADQDIADDQPEDATTAEAEEAPPEQPKVQRVKRRKYVVVYDDSYAQDDYGYQPQSYDLPSCHNKSYGY